MTFCVGALIVGGTRPKNICVSLFLTIQSKYNTHSLLWCETNKLKIARCIHNIIGPLNYQVVGPTNYKVPDDSAGSNKLDCHIIMTSEINLVHTDKLNDLVL